MSPAGARAALALSLLGPACTEPPGSARASAAPEPSTGSFAVVHLDGTERLYLPQHGDGAGNPSLAVVDLDARADGGSTAKALVATVDLGPGEDGDPGYATTTAGDSLLVLAASTVSPVVWFVNPTTNLVVHRLRLDGYGQSVLSGDGGYVTGIAIDAVRNRAYLGVWNGFAVLDLGARAVTHVIPAPPSDDFTFDPVHRRIYAPFFDCASSLDAEGNTPAACDTPRTPGGTAIADGLSVIDVDDETVYTYEDATAMDPAMPVGRTPISAGVDPATELVVVPSKASLHQTVIDFSRAVFDRAHRRVTAPSRIIGRNALPAVAVATDEHVAFWSGTGAADVAAARLSTLSPTAATADAAVTEPEFVFGVMPTLPDGSQWFNLTSSHGVAVYPGSRARPGFGVTVSKDSRYVARLDLDVLLDLPADHHQASDLTPAVTLLDARTSR